MTTPHGKKLLHAIVAMGVALTGGTVVACGGGTASTGSEDAAVDGPYDSIVAPDRYAQISYPADAYNGISIDSARPIDSGTDGYPQIGIDTGAPDVGSDCYPCIAPNGGG